MLVLFGFYRTSRSTVAYRQDFCVPCQEPQLAIQIRSFCIGHLYGIPLLPLGFHKEWSCAQCGQDPTRLQEGQRVLNLCVAGAVGLALLIAGLAAMEGLDSPEFQAMMKVATGVGVFAAGLYGVGRLMSRPRVDRTAMLASIAPAGTRECTLCGGPLGRRAGAAEAVLHCQDCGVARQQL